MLVLRSEAAIEVYDTSYNFYYEILLSPDFADHKVLFDGAFNYVVVLSQDHTFKSYKFPCRQIKKEMIKSTEETVEVPGNPAADVLY